MDSTTNDHDSFTDHTAATPRLRYTELEEWHATLNHPAMVVTLRLARLVFRGVLLFAFSFVEMIAELLAPIVLISGIGWALLPNILSMSVMAAAVGTEGEAPDLLHKVMQAIPQEIHLGHMVLTPTTLIVEGLLLIAVVALCRAVQTVLSAEL